MGIGPLKLQVPQFYFSVYGCGCCVYLSGFLNDLTNSLTFTSSKEDYSLQNLADDHLPVDSRFPCSVHVFS